MSGYPYLRSSFDSKPVNYSYSLYGGDPFLDSYFLVRSDAIQKISSDLLSAMEITFKSMDIEKQIEFIVFDHILNDSTYTSKLNINDHLREKKYWDDREPNRVTNLYLEYFNKLKGDRSTGKFGNKPALFVSLSEEKGFVTEEILRLIILSRIDNLLVEVDEAEKIVRKLSEKYEVFQRLFSSYNSSFKKNSDDFGNLSNYALLGIIAADIFENQENFKYLNTLLKINDLLINVDPPTINIGLLFLVGLKKEVFLINSLRGNIGKA